MWGTGKTKGDTEASPMTTPRPDDSADAETMKSMVTESNEELGKKYGPTDKLEGAWKWKSAANMYRTVKAFNYLKEETPDEAVPELQRTRSKTLFVKSRGKSGLKSPSVRAGVEELFLVEAEDEDEEQDKNLKPLALKYRVAASFLKHTLPYIFRNDGTKWDFVLDHCDLRIKANKTPIDGFYTSDVVIDAASDVWVRIFAPSESKDLRPVVVYFHGGGFAMYHTNSSDYDKLGRKIGKATNAIVISVNYRLTPKIKFPTQYDDCFKVLPWLQKTSPGSEFLPATADLSRCFLAGDSAGGNITHQVGIRAATTDLGPVKIRGWMMLQPFFGGKKRTESELTVKNPVLLTITLADWFWEAFLPEGATRDHEAANVFGPNAPDISRLPLPPIFLAIGTHDILKDRELAYAKEMAAIVGPENVTMKKYDGGFHGFFAFDHDLQKILMVDMASFVQATLDKQHL